MYSVEIRLDCAAFMMPGHGRSLQSSSLTGKCWKTWFTTVLSLWFYSDFTGWFVLRDFHRLLATKICIAETARALMRPSRSDGALRRPIRQILEPVAKRIATPTMATPLAPARPSEALETSQISQISQASVSVVAGTSIDQMQRQLQKAEAMLNCCVQSVEAAWDLSAQRLTEFDQKLSALDVRLVELSQKQVDDEETEARRQTARLVTLENRLDELVKRLENPQPEPQLNLESLDFLNHRVASLSERLAAEARVREAQFRRLESLLSQSQCTQSTAESEPLAPHRTLGTTVTSGATLTRDSSMPTLPGARSSFLEVVTDDGRWSGESDRRYHDPSRVPHLHHSSGLRDAT